jgi:hypothetical protein
MAESDCLKMLTDLYDEKGREGLLPANLPDVLLDRMASRGELDERERRNVISAAVSLFKYGHMRVSEHSADKEFHDAFMPYLMNVILESTDREDWLPGLIRPTMGNLFDADRLAISYNNTKWSLAQAIYSPPGTSPVREAKEATDSPKAGAKVASHSSILVTVDGDHLRALEELDEIFKTHIRGSRHLMSGYRTFLPIEKDGVVHWQYIWEDCHLGCDRRVIAKAVRQWGRSYAGIISELSFTAQNLVDALTITEKDLKSRKRKDAEN